MRLPSSTMIATTDQSAAVAPFGDEHNGEDTPHLTKES
jgi:hypothetical protein